MGRDPDRGILYVSRVQDVERKKSRVCVFSYFFISFPGVDFFRYLPRDWVRNVYPVNDLVVEGSTLRVVSKEK